MPPTLRQAQKIGRAAARINVNTDRFGSPAIEWGPAGRTYLVGPVAFRPALTGSLALSAYCLSIYSLPFLIPRCAFVGLNLRELLRLQVDKIHVSEISPLHNSERKSSEPPSQNEGVIVV